MNRLTKIDRYGHYYTNNANCRNIHSKDGENIEGVYFKGGVLAVDGEAIKKLGRLEDLEEELGCPLEVVFKALEEGIEYEIEITTYYVIGDTIPTKRLEKRKNIKEIKLKKYINKFAFFVPYDYSRAGIVQNDIIYLKDYQKTWWLKGEK